MLKPSTPANEAARLKALEALEVLDTPPEERFDRYTRLAQHILQTPVVLISLVDGQRQWFKSRQGIEATETPRDISFCGHAILDDDLFCVYDASVDPRFADNPLVTEAPDIRFYAGAPLILRGGERVGTLCAIDRIPRNLSEAQRAALIDLSHCVADELQLQTTRNILAGREAQLQKSTELVRSIIDTVVDGIITIDARGNIQTVNPTAERMFGYASEEMLGQNVKMLMPEPFHHAHDGYLHSYLSTGHKKIIGIGREVVGRRRDGSTFPMELAVGEMKVQGEPMFTGIIRDVTERNAARQALQESAERLSLATQAAGMGVWEYDLDTQELVWDDRMFQIYGIKREDFSNAYEAWCTCLSPQQLAMAEVELRAAIKGEKALQAEFALIWPNGEEHVVEAAALALRDHKGHAVRMVGVNLDITERKRMEQMKNEFVSTVSHELRTPLTSIKGALGLIRSGVTGELPDKMSTMLDIAYNNCDRLVRLINDILDIEKIEAGKMDFHMLPLDLVPLIQESLEANREYAKAHKVIYSFHAEIDAAKVQGDHDRLIQAMTNLLSNAAKFSPSGGCVKIRLTQINDLFRIEIQDRGLGIPAAFHSKIFSKFSQADGSDTRQKGGTGLGLNITQAIVEEHLGKIGFESTQGVGTTFYIELPCFREGTDQALTETDGEPSAERVLVCEDEPDIAAILRQILSEANFLVDLATTAEEAMTKLLANDYAAMTLDLRLPDEDGMMLLRRLRSHTRNADIPVIVVSVLAETISAESSADDRAMVSDWQQKPIDSQRLVAALSKALLPGSSDRSRILHVEDDADICEVVSRLLDSSIDVIAAPTLLSARQKINQDVFDLILLDLTLPDGSGEDLLRGLPFSRNLNTPVVIFSARELSANKPAVVQSALLKSKTDNDRLLKTIIGALRPRQITSTETREK